MLSEVISLRTLQVDVRMVNTIDAMSVLNVFSKTTQIIASRELVPGTCLSAAKLQANATDIPPINNRLHDSFIFVLVQLRVFCSFHVQLGSFCSHPPNSCLLVLPPSL